MKAAGDAMPTLEQVESEILSAEAEMSAAKARKDYHRAAELSIKLPAMHDRHSVVAAVTRQAMNRKQLAEEIWRHEGEVRGNSHLPLDLDRLHAIFLCRVLSTMHQFRHVSLVAFSPSDLTDSYIPIQ